MSVVIVLGVVVGVVLLAVALVYNRLVARRNTCRNAWAQIDVQLRRRTDLVPNLVATVSGYADHERALFAKVARERARALSAGDDVADRMRTESQLTDGLRSLLVVAEAYPQLRADATFRQLMHELSDTEDRIAFARQYNNDTVQEYNTMRESFPAVLVAGALGFGPAESWTLADDDVRAAPTVEF